MSKKTKSNANEEQARPYCNLPEVKERDLSNIVDGRRSRLISQMEKMWVNGTELNYYFFQTPKKWQGAEQQEQAVKDAFSEWKNLGIGLEFREVTTAEEAQIKIGFDQADGSWSYVGRDCLQISDPRERTMNFGWDLTTPYGKDTALHEIGHALSFPHEHQNPKAGIVWDENAVYEYFSEAPNYWSREDTYWNIIRKIPPNTVDGSNWDKNSIMHYEFGSGLIITPEVYQTKPLIPNPGLSNVDVDTVKKFYPPLPERTTEIIPFESKRFKIKEGEQVDFLINPAKSRKYTLQTFGKMDTVMVLFERRNGAEEFIDGDDDSGKELNSRIEAHLSKGREYIVRTRLYYTEAQGSGSIMVY